METKRYNLKYFQDHDSLDLHLAESLRIFARKQRLKKILDVGCGTGLLVKFFNDHGFTAYGVDLSPLAVKIAGQKNCRRKIFLAKAEKLPFIDSSFDFVTCISVVEHLTIKQVNFFFKETYRVLKKGGWFFIVTPNFATPFRLVQGKKWFAYGDPTHLDYYTPFSLSRLSKQQGFTKIRLLFKSAYNLNFVYHLPKICWKLPLPLINILNFLITSTWLFIFKNSFWIAGKKS